MDISDAGFGPKWHDSEPIDRRSPSNLARGPEPTVADDPVDMVSIDSRDENGEPRQGPKKAGRAHGVIRLVAEGHFKPNAEARLRENFADLLEPLDETDGAPATDTDRDSSMAPSEELDLAGEETSSFGANGLTGIDIMA